MSRARVGVSADAFVAVVRAYADRVHDDVRRLGCTEAEAAEVVETSALGLAERLRVRPHEVTDLVGTWFRDARLLAERVGSGVGAEDLAAGAGIVQRSEDDAATRSALAEVGERDRVALLLRDAYDLPYPSVGVALGLDPDAAAAVVAKARLAFLRHVGEAPGEPGPGHDADLANTARLADGSLLPDAARSAERHATKCTACAPVLPAQREARRLLSGLAILALPDTDRDALMGRAEAVATRVLPSAEEVARAERDGDVRIMPPAALVAGCLLGAFLLGSVVALSGDDASLSARGGVPSFDPSFPTPTPSPTSATPTPTPTPSRTATPTATRTVPPSRTATPSPTPTFEWFAGSERMALDKTRGDNGETVHVTGTGWKPGEAVTIVYLNVVGTETGQRATAVPDANGRFTATLVAHDPANIPGPHRIRARNASGQEEIAQYDAQP